ncbi:AAA family ATPase [bacterium]|nr:AAA family ATPase [bacterium]
MITLIEALNYRCLHYIRQPLDRFHVLVGPNASGKTTFLDVVAFCSDFVTGGLKLALEKRSPNFQDLVFGRAGKRFELALEFAVPENLKARTAFSETDLICRYELAVAANSSSNEVLVDSEAVRFLSALNRSKRAAVERSLFPDEVDAPDSLVMKSVKGVRKGLSKSLTGITNFYSEADKKAGKGWTINLRLGPQKSALANLPEDQDKFPVSTWLKELLTSGVQTLALDGRTLRSASPPNQPRQFKTDASNIPWVIEDFRSKYPQRFQKWLMHLREALPTLHDVDTYEQPWDKHRYIRLEYDDGLKIPSWTASDGTLRLLALTLPAFLPELHGVFLIEEPENGIHPKAVEILYEALSCVYHAQILVATHSPVLLGMVKPEQILRFARNDAGATDIVRGDRHPMLTDWQQEVSLQDYFVSGVLG